MTASTPNKADEREIVITRILNAPRELVWKAWTDPKQVAQWWGPKGFTNPVCEMDVKLGGAFRIHMRGPDGSIYPMSGVYQEIVAGERLVFTNIAEDMEGHHLLEGLTTVIFKEQDGKTKLIVETRMAGLVTDAARMLEGMKEGWEQTLDCLEEYIVKA